MVEPIHNSPKTKMEHVDLSDLEARLQTDDTLANDARTSAVSGTMDTAVPPSTKSTTTPTTQTAAGGSDYDRQFDTLDEPVWHTVRRDLSAIGGKLKHVFFPRDNRTLLKEWDLWGPLFLCVFLSLMLQGGEHSTTYGESSGPQFTDVFLITFAGACIVTLNIKLLGGEISFFQCVCVLGYCLVPCVCASIVCAILSVTHASVFIVVKLGVAVVACLWAIYASTAFLSGVSMAKRKALMIYPICLFYAIITCMVVSHF